jgi:hypothetical protein
MVKRTNEDPLQGSPANRCKIDSIVSQLLLLSRLKPQLEALVLPLILESSHRYYLHFAPLWVEGDSSASIRELLQCEDARSSLDLAQEVSGQKNRDIQSAHCVRAARAKNRKDLPHHTLHSLCTTVQ